MKILNYKRGLAVILGLILAVQTPLGVLTPSVESYAYTERRATVNATSLNVRSGPGTTNSIVAKLSHGTSVTVIGEKNASDGALWYQIRFGGSNGTEVTGYASNSYIKFPVTYTKDTDFEAYMTSQGFPESYKVGLRQLHAQYPNWVFTAQKTGLDWNTVIQNESIVGRNLVHKSSISSWKSTADGAYNWDSASWPGFDSSSWVAASEDIIKYYMDPRNFLDETNVFQFLLQSYDGSAHTASGLQSLVSGSFLGGTASGSGNSGSSGGTIPGGGSSSGGSGPSGSGDSSGGDSNYGPGMNVGGGSSQGGSSGSSSPVTGGGNGVIDSSAPTSGNNSGVKLEGPRASVSKHETDRVATSYGPGMSGSTPGGSGSNGASYGSAPLSGSSSYVDIIMNAGAQSGVNPYVLAAMIIQEQGANGTGGSISGTEAGYGGYYNFFNIEAYQSGSMSPVQRGLWYASQSGNYERPWNSVEKSIMGGALYYAVNYVKVGQDTFYLKKFNVQGSNLYKHQYMTNIQGAASEAAKLSKAYSTDLKKTGLEFKIPIYNNMPDSPAPKPTLDGSPNNKLSSLNASGFSLTPTFNRDTTSYDLIVDQSVSSVNISASAIDSAATVSGTGNIGLQNGNNDIKVSVKAQNGSVREYVIHVVRQTNGPTYSEGTGGSPASSGSGGSGSGPGGTGPGGAQSGAGTSPGGTDVITVNP